MKIEEAMDYGADSVISDAPAAFGTLVDELDRFRPVFAEGRGQALLVLEAIEAMQKAVAKMAVWELSR